MARVLLYVLLLAVLSILGESKEQFHEELVVRPLAGGYVNTYFQFTTRWHFGERNNLHNTQLMPRPIAEILLKYDVKELHIGLTQGLWRYETWGYPVVDAAPGAEAWAWFAGVNLTEAQVDAQWVQLASTFSGILCASLNFIDATNSVKPKLGFRPQFVDGGADSDRFVRYAALPREIVCTENLTPWKKLLPCASKHGFASLLNSGHVHNTAYHSLRIKMRTICDKQTGTATQSQNCILEFTESANLVYDTRLLSSSGGGSGVDFSLRRLFGQGLNGHCALAASSKIYVQLDEEEHLAARYELTPPPALNITSLRGGTTTRYGVYDAQRLEENGKLFNIAWIWRKQPPMSVLPSPRPPPLIAHRHILGQGQERGQIVTHITNNLDVALPVVLQEHIPWFVPAYMHTLKLSVVSSASSSLSQSQLPQIRPQALHYLPGAQRSRPYHLELAFVVPKRSTVQVAFDFDYIFLKWLEYPPDANHGHYLGSAIVSAQLPLGRNYSVLSVEASLFADTFNASRPAYFLALRTESLILSLPTPDFSMPYNVICLACTVVALAFGPIHSVATKHIVVDRQPTAGDGAAPGKLRQLMQKLLKFGKRHQPVAVLNETSTLKQQHPQETVKANACGSETE